MNLALAVSHARDAVRAELGPELTDPTDDARAERSLTTVLLAFVLADWPRSHEAMCGLLLDLAAADQAKAGAG